MTVQKTIQIYVTLLDEGTPTIRPTKAIVLEKNLYQLLPTPNYDPEDETWEFLPNSIVIGETILTDENEPVLLAVKKPA
ncbi:MAG: hypothetical protein EBQ96_08555 [Proteobacteria bacterium]|nr:hypothetical protein [Pseudomonadota bacterium]